MSNINDSAIDYVKSLFDKVDSNKIVANSGTDLGDIKSDLLERKGAAFIEENDLYIDRAIHKELYS